MKLNLGCGDDYREGYYNVDSDTRVKADVHCNVMKVLSWFPRGPYSEPQVELSQMTLTPIDEIIAYDILEHLPSVVDFFDRCWHALAPNGVLRVRVPHASSHNAWIDPTHVRPFMLETFWFFDPDYLGRLGRKRTISRDEWKINVTAIGDDENIYVDMTPRKD